MNKPTPDIPKAFRMNRLIWPLLIGLGVLAFAVYRIAGEEQNPLTHIDWSWRVLGMILLGFVAMVIRDLGYIWRMRILTDKKLSWRSAIEVTLLWEFASSLTPSVVGGSAVAILMLVKEKISAGRSTAIVFVTIFLDEIFYLIMFPLMLLVVSHEAIFSNLLDGGEFGAFDLGIIVSFWIAYGIIFGYTLFLAFAIFLHPKGITRTIKRLFSTRLLKRWQRYGFRAANDLSIASEEFRSKPFVYWMKAWWATFAAWMGRFLVLHFILAAFLRLSLAEHAIAFARQAVMFVVMIVSPTPGSSGVAEWAFESLFGEFFYQHGLEVGFVLLIATLWRMVTYYPYVFLGIWMLPRWLRRVYEDAPPESEDPEGRRL